MKKNYLVMSIFVRIPIIAEQQVIDNQSYYHYLLMLIDLISIVSTRLARVQYDSSLKKLPSFLSKDVPLNSKTKICRIAQQITILFLINIQCSLDRLK